MPAEKKWGREGFHNWIDRGWEKKIGGMRTRGKKTGRISNVAEAENGEAGFRAKRSARNTVGHRWWVNDVITINLTSSRFDEGGMLFSPVDWAGIGITRWRKFTISVRTTIEPPPPPPPPFNATIIVATHFFHHSCPRAYVSRLCSHKLLIRNGSLHFRSFMSSFLYADIHLPQS